METIRTKKILRTKPKDPGQELAPKPLPKTLTRAAGLLAGKLKKTSLQYQRAFRKEWS
jgi:hypothetical protein